MTLCGELEEMLAPYLRSQSLEIQERATSLAAILAIYKATFNNEEKEEVASSEGGQQQQQLLLGLNSPTTETAPVISADVQMLDAELAPPPPSSQSSETVAAVVNGEVPGEGEGSTSPFILGEQMSTTAAASDVQSSSLSSSSILKAPETTGDEQQQTTTSNGAASVNFEALFYAYPLNPVAAKAQRKVPIPAGLDLELAFYEEE